MLKKTDAKVMQKVREHILYFMNREELKENYNNCMKYTNEGGNYDYYIEKLIEGGCFLVYNDDIEQFIKETMEFTEKDCKQHDFNKIYRLYTLLIRKAVKQLLRRDAICD